jgi:cell division protein FtsZ
LCEGADVIFVVAGLGGGTGTGAGPVVAQVAKETGALVLAIVMLPFDCEGSRRQRQAQLGLHDLKNAADGVISLPNQKVFKLIDEKTSLLEAFGINELVARAYAASGGCSRVRPHQYRFRRSLRGRRKTPTRCNC